MRSDLKMKLSSIFLAVLATAKLHAAPECPDTTIRVNSNPVMGLGWVTGALPNQTRQITRNNAIAEAKFDIENNTLPLFASACITNAQNAAAASNSGYRVVSVMTVRDEWPSCNMSPEPAPLDGCTGYDLNANAGDPFDAWECFIQLQCEVACCAIVEPIPSPTTTPTELPGPTCVYPNQLNCEETPTPTTTPTYEIPMPSPTPSMTPTMYPSPSPTP